MSNIISELNQAASLVAVAKKNQVPGKPTAGRNYTIISKTLESWGKIPQQQQDLAKILLSEFQVGTPVPESELFAKLNEKRAEFPSLRESKQDVTYLFRYYRGLKNDGKHAGFIARNFITQSN